MTTTGTGDVENKDIRVLQAKEQVDWDSLKAALPRKQIAFFLSSKILLFNLEADNIHEEHMWTYINKAEEKSDLQVGEHASLV